MATLELTQGCWNEDTGSPMAFLQWRALLARAAGFSMEVQEAEDGFQFEAPVLDFDQITWENTQGVWVSQPEEPLLIILAHMSHEGEITPNDAEMLADRIEQLLQDGSIAKASHALPDSIAAHVELMRTEQVIEGLRRSKRHNDPVVFSISED